jgi:hypothetical protein
LLSFPVLILVIVERSREFCVMYPSFTVLLA